MHRVLLPWEYHVNVERGRLIAQMGDLYPRWVGTRELLLHGRNPYGPEVSREIQIGFYGHPIEQSYDKPATEIIDEQRFAYPVYVVFFLAPTVKADFEELQQSAPIIFAGLLACSVVLWLAVVRWRPPLVVSGAMILIVLSTPQIAQGLRLRQFGFVVIFLLGMGAWGIVRGQLFWAGVLFAIATIKPQMIVLCLVWFAIWTLGEWKKRWPLAAGFSMALALLAGSGELLVPGWLRYFLEGLAAYRKYFPTTSPIRLILGNWFGGAISVAVLVALLSYAWAKRTVEAHSPEFVDLLALFCIASTLILPLLTPYNQALLLLPIVVLMRDWNRLPRFGRMAFVALLAWPGVVSVLLLFHPPDVDSLRRTPLLPSVLVLLIPFVVCWLYFARGESSAQVVPRVAR